MSVKGPWERPTAPSHVPQPVLAPRAGTLTELTSAGRGRLPQQRLRALGSDNSCCTARCGAPCAISHCSAGEVSIVRLGSCPLCVNCIVTGECTLDHRLGRRATEQSPGTVKYFPLSYCAASTPGGRREKHPERENLVPWDKAASDASPPLTPPPSHGSSWLHLTPRSSSPLPSLGPGTWVMD